MPAEGHQAEEPVAPRTNLGDPWRPPRSSMMKTLLRTLLGTAARPHAIPWQQRMGVSLDHAVWIHHEPLLDDWLLYTSESPIAHGGHGMVFGSVWYPDGRRLASVAQEGLIRRRRD